MIAQVETLNYRSLRYIRQPLEPFAVLIGPNASGKSTFLDVIAFLADLVREKEGVSAAVAARAPDISDLTWMRRTNAFELAVEAVVPPELRRQKNGQAARLRYEVSVGQPAPGEEVSLLAETLWLRPEPAENEEHAPPRTLFPLPQPPPATVIHSPGQRTPQGWRRVVDKVPDSGNDYFRSETSDWNNLFRLGPRRSALANLPEDEDKFPAAIWFRRLLLEGVQRFRTRVCCPGAGVTVLVSWGRVDQRTDYGGTCVISVGFFEQATTSVSFRPDLQIAKRGHVTMKKYTEPLAASELAGLPDDTIDYSDIPELDEEFWQHAELVRPAAKERITLRLDQDVLDYFRRGGQGYQTRINAVLRAYIQMQEGKRAPQ
jgi:uncharacterized protein (DUF4415 family)